MIFEQLFVGNSKYLQGKVHKMLLQYDTETERVKKLYGKWNANV